MERIQAQNPDFEGSKKILEVNLSHELIRKLDEIGCRNQSALLCLLEQAKIADGELPADAQQFSADIIKLDCLACPKRKRRSQRPRRNLMYVERCLNSTPHP